MWIFLFPLLGHTNSLKKERKKNRLCFFIHLFFLKKFHIYNIKVRKQTHPFSNLIWMLSMKGKKSNISIKELWKNWFGRCRLFRKRNITTQGNCWPYLHYTLKGKIAISTRPMWDSTHTSTIQSTEYRVWQEIREF